MTKKRYILFKIPEVYDATGGLDNIVMVFDSLEELEGEYKPKGLYEGRFQVLDTEEFEIGVGDHPKNAFGNLAS